MALVQLLIAGLALATRFEESRGVKIVIKEVPKWIAIRTPASVTAREDRTYPPSVVSPPPSSLPSTPAPSPISVPRVSDPRAEHLVKEGQKARVAGDMGLAIVKLTEAQNKSPNDPTVLYELGLIHEQMGVFDTAGVYYEKVFHLGISGAGSLYSLAAGKLREGIQKPDAMAGKLALGRVQIFKDLKNESEQRVVLTIPVQKSPDGEIDIAEMGISVIFFNKTSKGEIVQLEDNSWVTEQWASLPFDWNGGEESLRMTYRIPNQDSQTEHLFGGRTYYGQVVSLLYKGEILDVQAWPRDLAAKIPSAPNSGRGDPLLPEFQDVLPPEFDPNLPLLPPLPSK
jgi:hypothetical protein